MRGEVEISVELLRSAVLASQLPRRSHLLHDISKMDADGDGRVSLVEFISHVSRMEESQRNLRRTAGIGLGIGIVVLIILVAFGAVSFVLAIRANEIAILTLRDIHTTQPGGASASAPPSPLFASPSDAAPSLAAAAGVELGGSLAHLAALTPAELAGIERVAVWATPRLFLPNLAVASISLAYPPASANATQPAPTVTVTPVDTAVVARVEVWANGSVLVSLSPSFPAPPPGPHGDFDYSYPGDAAFPLPAGRRRRAAPTARAGGDGGVGFYTGRASASRGVVACKAAADDAVVASWAARDSAAPPKVPANAPPPPARRAAVLVRLNLGGYAVVEYVGTKARPTAVAISALPDRAGPQIEFANSLAWDGVVWEKQVVGTVVPCGREMATPADVADEMRTWAASSNFAAPTHSPETAVEFARAALGLK